MEMKMNSKTLAAQSASVDSRWVRWSEKMAVTTADLSVLLDEHDALRQANAELATMAKDANLPLPEHDAASLAIMGDGRSERAVRQAARVFRHAHADQGAFRRVKVA
jgi:hypothetical protein